MAKCDESDGQLLIAQSKYSSRGGRSDTENGLIKRYFGSGRMHSARRQ